MVQLPAVNTPQFDWARSRFHRKLAPVAPIFQPETVAEAVYRAAHVKPREYWLGFSTVKAIVAQILVPGLADRYLADAGKTGETVDQPAETDRPDNLFAAGRGDPGAHGRFDDRSSSYAMPFDPAWLRFGIAVFVAASATLAASALAKRARTGRSYRDRL